MSGPLVPNRSDVALPQRGEVGTLEPGAVAALAAAPPPEPGANQFTRIIAALRRFAWLIALCTGLGVVGGFVATKILRPQYTIVGTVWIEGGGGRGTGPIQAPGLLSSFSWLELLRTYVVLDPVVKEIRLYLKPGSGSPLGVFQGFELGERFAPGQFVLTVDEAGRRYTLKTRDGRQVGAGQAGDSIGREAGFKWLPPRKLLTPELKMQFTVITPREASVELNARLNSRMNEDGNFIRLNLTDGSAQRGARTMNALQRQFFAVAADLKRKKLTELTAVLRDQLSQQEGRLRNAEQALESFRVRTVTEPKENVAVIPGLDMTQGTAFNAYFQQRVQLDGLRRDRKSLEDVLGRLRRNETTVDAFRTIPAVGGATALSQVLTELSTAEADLRALLTKYTPEYKPVKDVQEKINTIRSTTVPLYVEALIRQLQIEEQNLVARMGGSEAELRGIPVRAITEARLQRDMQSADVLFKTLQNRFEEARLAELSAIPDVRILDEAVAPTRPNKNNATKLFLVALAGGIGLGLGLALLLDRLDKRFRYPDQATHELGLAILGVIPVLPRIRPGGASDAEETAQVVEAFRSIRLNLAHSYGPANVVCLTVSSPSPGDGKSLVASNLGLSFAEAGYRTLVLDADTRRGELHRTFGVERRPGLLDYLRGAATLEQIIRPTSHRQLSLIPCGTRSHNAPELLGSARMAELIAQLRAKFEVVIADSPPLGAGIDPFVMGTVTGHMLMVLRSGETDREMAEAKLRILDRLPVRMLGAVLNHVRTGMGAYKYYSYSYGYASEDELEHGTRDAQLPAGSGRTTS